MRPLIYAVSGALVFAAPAQAKEQAPIDQPAVFQAVLDCRGIADTAARLACFDKATQALADAAKANDVLVVDRATASKTKRSLFGLALPRIKLFGDHDDEEIQQIESTIASTYSARDGTTVFVLPDGARWKQTEGRDTFPRNGQKIVILKGTLGGYFARVNGQTGVRVMRLPQSQ
ncbi:MAG: hypothetical protein ACKOPE_11475 [Novosphingobium sp.]